MGTINTKDMPLSCFPCDFRSGINSNEFVCVITGQAIKLSDKRDESCPYSSPEEATESDYIEALQDLGVEVE